MIFTDLSKQAKIGYNALCFNPLIQVNDFYVEKIEDEYSSNSKSFNPLIQVNDFYMVKEIVKIKKVGLYSFNPLIQVNDFYSQDTHSKNNTRHEVLIP